jgi:hypothetical protein
MYSPSSAPLPTRDGPLIEGHFTSFALDYIAFQVSLSTSSRPTSTAPLATLPRRPPYVWRCPESGHQPAPPNSSGRRQHFPTINGHASLRGTMPFVVERTK